MQLLRKNNYRFQRGSPLPAELRQRRWSAQGGGEKYIFTNHAFYKMRHYRLSESLVKRVMRYPARTEESIVEGTIACMRPAQAKKYHEIWVMYKIANSKGRIASGKKINGQIKIITAWRYPGKSPKRDPIPQNILQEIRSII